jgi:hypothetical protein
MNERMEVLMKQIWRRAVLGAVSTMVAALAVASPASAGLLVETTSDCDGQELSKPFARWLDPMSYTLVPGGSLEDGAAGWKLGGGARVVAGNEPWQVNDSGDSASLRLPAGSSAVTAPICVGLEHPTVRLFARKNSGFLSVLTVTAVVTLQGGGKLEVPFGVVAAGSKWGPTLPMLFLGNALPILPGQYTPVSFRFTPVLGGDWQIDDVYVDPYRAR